jgi:hypothetical protein
MRFGDERPLRTALMNLCAVCGQHVPGNAGVCAHHAAAEGGWAAGNRIMCDFFHRRIAPSRLNAVDRDGDLGPGSLGPCLSAEI